MGRLANPRARRVHRVLAAPDGACISGAAIALRLRFIGESLALSAVALQSGHPIVAGSTSPAHDREMICRGSARINGRKRSQTDHDPRSKSLPALEKRTPPHLRACEQRHGRRHRLSEEAAGFGRLPGSLVDRFGICLGNFYKVSHSQIRKRATSDHARHPPLTKSTQLSTCTIFKPHQAAHRVRDMTATRP